MKVLFYKLAIGAVFVWYGRRYEKTAISMTEADDGTGCIFMAGCEVEVEGVPLLLPSAEAEKWRPTEERCPEHVVPSVAADPEWRRLQAELARQRKPAASDH